MSKLNNSLPNHIWKGSTVNKHSSELIDSAMACKKKKKKKITIFVCKALAVCTFKDPSEPLATFLEGLNLVHTTYS